MSSHGQGQSDTLNSSAMQCVGFTSHRGFLCGHLVSAPCGIAFQPSRSASQSCRLPLCSCPSALPVPQLPGTTGWFLLRLELCKEQGPAVALGCCVLGAHMLHT